MPHRVQRHLLKGYSNYKRKLERKTVAKREHVPFLKRLFTKTEWYELEGTEDPTETDDPSAEGEGNSPETTA